jgi:hypothetical protein
MASPKKIPVLPAAASVESGDQFVVGTDAGTAWATAEELHLMPAASLPSATGQEGLLADTPDGVHRILSADLAEPYSEAAAAVDVDDVVKIHTSAGFREIAIGTLLMIAATAAETITGVEAVLVGKSGTLRSTTALALLQQALVAAGSAASATGAEYLVRVGGVAKAAKVADIHAADFAAKAKLSADDSIIGLKSDGTPVRIPGSGFLAAKNVQKVRLKVNGGKTYFKYTASGSTTKTAIRNLILADNPDLAGVPDSLIFLDVQAIQGGSGGAWGTSGVFGGFGGHVAYKSGIPLSALSETVPYAVGIGGSPGNGGGYSEFCNSGAPDAWVQSSLFSARGGNTKAEHTSYVEAMRGGQGYAGPDTTLTANAYATTIAPNSYTGPGHGGAASSSVSPYSGGGSSFGRVRSKVGGPTTQGQAGFDAKDDDFWSYGTGAAGNPAGTGGNGGVPGGGGGGGRDGNATSTGAGGRGEVRWRAYILKMAL